MAQITIKPTQKHTPIKTRTLEDEEASLLLLNVHVRLRRMR